MKASKLTVKIILLLLIVTIVFCVDFLLIPEGHAEETTAYVFCSDFVYIRPYPNKKGEEIGRLETGDELHLDGKKRNGYLHCVDTGFEAQEGWIYSGYVVYDEPVRANQSATVTSKGRLAARKNVGGKRTRWLKPQSTVIVYYWSDEWCVTNCGYVQSKYLELEGM